MSDSLLVRQPVFGSSGALIGYEIRYNDVDDGRNAFAQSLLSGSFDLVRNQLPAFVAATRDQLLDDVFLVAAPSSVIVMLPPDLEVDDSVHHAIERLRAAGVGLALELMSERPTAVESLSRQVSWVRVDARSGDVAAIKAICDRIAQGVGSSVPKRMAVQVENLQQYEASLQQGFDAFQGTFFSRPEPLPSTDVPQNTIAALRLMSLARDPSVTDPELENVIATDPVLTFQLLRLVNSAAIGGRGVSSIGQALRLIGRAAFLRWLAVAVAAARRGSSAVDHELVRQAVERGRFLEQLHGNGRDAGTLFLVGLFSLLDAVFRMPMADLLARVKLSPEATEALLSRTGPYADAITFAESYELGLFENAMQIAHDMGIDESRVGDYYTNAITWTAEAIGAVLGGSGARH